MKPLTETYHDWLATSIDPEGFEIPHALVLAQDDTLTVIALAVSPDRAYQVMLAQRLKGAKEMIFALDRFAKPDQGTTLGDLMAGHHFADGIWRPFVVEYQYDPRIVRPFDWDNTFWNGVLRREMAQSIHNIARELVP